MPLSQPRTPRSHRARHTRRHAGAATAAAGRRAVRRPPLLSAAGGLHPAALSAAALAGLVSLTVAVRAGALTRLWEFLDYGAGVLSLVSLTSTVLWGLAATDRTLLASGHRLVAQGVHRGLGVAGLGFLALHIWVKVAQSQTGAASAVLPFADPDRPLLIGLGTLAGYLFVAVAVSGAARSAFATKGRSLWWRALHMGAYPAWGASLVHGLKAGRAAAGWVTVAYGLCLAGVAAVLVIRLRARLRALPARPAVVAPPPSRTPGQGPPRTPRPFVRKPAEWAAARLTARLARQTQPAAAGGAGSGPLPGDLLPGDPLPGDPLLTARAAAGPGTQSRPAPPPYPPPPYPAPPYGAPPYPAVFIPSRLGVADRPGEPLGGARGRQ
ncbi:hypothetical protein [Streptomyces sp. NBC_00539]|uniref:hypothetical protein n=1 Tax=Streptomyces sp. NBC_00539 TaxID=2975770 RepID=UPI002E80CF0D|nr:hypothetical protein [Streptomyces sp. NBC_00539]WUC63682.1 hypothetical protein OG861_05280 [Streptomyces sp. NBC_00539]